MGLAGKEAGSGGTTHYACDQCSQHLHPTEPLLSDRVPCQNSLIFPGHISPLLSGQS